MILNGFVAITLPFAISQITQAQPTFPVWAGWGSVLMALLNVVFLVAIFKWKKWGFYGFAVATIVSCALNFYAGVGVALSLIGLVGIAILFGVLQIGGKKKGWGQLE
ncbi:MAG TPA: hypothetical protein VGO50_03320 [Pyrinomonadaceae bacterium]|jgi:hypothetical protein|nr:hypothetical protein [Pyrinomonadaceae bacterium]